MITATILDRTDGIRHGFFTRDGGVSEGPYASLNCGLGSDDDPARVRANRTRAMARLGRPGASLATGYQVHSARVAVVERPWPDDGRPEVDALVTRTPGVALGILTADCAPVLLADARARVVGAVHAGWRGAWSGVIGAAVAAMEDLGASRDRIVAAVGPCIHQASYEVGPEFRDQVTNGERAAERFFRPSRRAGHAMFDLPGYVASRIEALALAGFEASPHDTCADEARFFSYRRVTLNGGGDYGRMLSAIVLER
jgi:YfiH family protein